MFNEYQIASIRILPNDKVTFPTEEDFKHFVTKTMPQRGGYYHFLNQMMKCPQYTLVLFQYDGMIRAAGLLIGAERKAVVDEFGVEYSGSYHFDVNTLRYLDYPIGRDSLRSIYPAFKTFSQVKQEIPLEYKNALLDLFEQARKTYIHNNDDISLVNDIELALEKTGLQGRDYEALVKARVNQSVFRKRLLRKYHACCLCGLNIEHLLVASHIKPWHKSDSQEKLDENNGLLMCPNHDRLFDKGLISFDEDGFILISSHLTELDKILLKVDDSLRIVMNDYNSKYMEYHRKHIFSTE